MCFSIVSYVLTPPSAGQVWFNKTDLFWVTKVTKETSEHIVSPETSSAQEVQDKFITKADSSIVAFNTIILKLIYYSSATKNALKKAFEVAILKFERNKKNNVLI